MIFSLKNMERNLEKVQGWLFSTSWGGKGKTVNKSGSCPEMGLHKKVFKVDCGFSSCLDMAPIRGRMQYALTGKNMNSLTSRYAMVG
jgi:hypothetical protein